MWKKNRSKPSEEEISNRGGGEDEEVNVQDEINKEEEEGELGLGFYACYLLASLSPRYKGHSYIGFTVNPRRRIRQHNGEITSGAWKTKKKRPWEMVLCIYGFPTNVSALQFEWAWQHPTESSSVRSAAATFKSLSGIVNKIKLAYTMLTLPTWQGMTLTVNFFSTKYTKHSAGCPNLPRHMEVQVCPMDDLPCYVEGYQNVWKNGEENGSDWYEDEEHDRCSSPDENIQEGITDITAQYSAVSQSGIESTLKEKVGQSEENGVRQTMEPITPKDWEEDLCSADSLPLCSTRPILVISEETMAERRIEVQGGLQHGRLPRKPVSSGCSVIASEVEVIDISTPSPDFPSCTKNRRAAHPQIIDLTRSPIFIRL